jgi:hypothetical protein
MRDVNNSDYSQIKLNIPYRVSQRGLCMQRVACVVLKNLI